MFAIDMLAARYMASHAAPDTVIENVTMTATTAFIDWSQKAVNMWDGGGGSYLGDNKGTLKVTLSELLSMPMEA